MPLDARSLIALKLSNSQTATDVYAPQAIEERRPVAGRCEAAMEHGIRTYVDEVVEN